VLPLGLKPRHVEKFRACRLTDVGESELTDEKEETCAKHKITFGTHRRMLRNSDVRWRSSEVLSIAREFASSDLDR